MGSSWVLLRTVHTNRCQHVSCIAAFLTRLIHKRIAADAVLVLLRARSGAAGLGGI